MRALVASLLRTPSEEFCPFCPKGANKSFGAHGALGGLAKMGVFTDMSRSSRYAALARRMIVESSTIAMPPAQRSSDAGAAKMASINSPNSAPAAAPIRAL